MKCLFHLTSKLECQKQLESALEEITDAVRTFFTRFYFGVKNTRLLEKVSFHMSYVCNSINYHVLPELFV